MTKALVTGGSRGIGKVICEFLRQRQIDVLAPTHQEMDLNDLDSIHQYMHDKTDIDILINCAGINNLASIAEMTIAEFQKTLNVDLIAPTLLIKYVTPHMKSQNWGRIVNFASIWSKFSKERRIMYSIAKSGIVGLTTAAAVELTKHNIMVNAIAPGFIGTEMTYQNNTPEQIQQLSDALPIKRLGTPEEIAEFVCFLISTNNSFMSGQTIYVDGGFSCV